MRDAFDAELRGNISVLLAFAFESGLVARVCTWQELEQHFDITLPMATFIVECLSRALIGKSLSGRSFNAERTFVQMYEVLKDKDHEFNDLIEEYGARGDGVPVADE